MLELNLYGMLEAMVRNEVKYEYVGYGISRGVVKIKSGIYKGLILKASKRTLCEASVEEFYGARDIGGQFNYENRLLDRVIENCTTEGLEKVKSFIHFPLVRDTGNNISIYEEVEVLSGAFQAEYYEDPDLDSSFVDIYTEIDMYHIQDFYGYEVLDDLDDVDEIFRDLNIESSDTHPGNLGIHNGRLKSIDYSYYLGPM